MDSVQNDEGDPLGSPSLKLVCGKTLARIPPGEGLGFIGPALAADRRLGAGEPRGGSRFGRERLSIDRHQHGCVGVRPIGTLVETADARKGTFEFLHVQTIMKNEIHRALIGGWSWTQND